MVRRVRPECPDPESLDPHENPRAHQNVDHTKVGDTVKFPQHDPNLAPQEPATTLPPTRPRSSGARIPQRVPLTSPVPQRARPSVGVPARFPDQPPVVLFNPNDFAVRPPVAPQQPPNPNTNRFVPVAPQQFPIAQPAAGPSTQPPFIPFNFQNPFNNGFTQFTQTQQVGLPGIPAIEPIVVTGRPDLTVQQQRQPARPNLARQPEFFQGDFASAPALGPNDTPELNRFNGQAPNRFVPVAQPEIFQGDRPAAAPLGPNNPVLRPVVVATEPPVLIPVTTEQQPQLPPIEAERNQAAQVQPSINDFVPLPQPNNPSTERPAPTFAPTFAPIFEPIEVTTTAVPSVPVVAETTTTPTPETTTRRFRGRQRRPIETSEEIPENEEEDKTSNVDDEGEDDSLKTSIRNRNLFNTENRKVPLNRFRGRQRIVKVVQKTENENGEVVLSEITGPGASQRPRGNRRPVAIRRRPIGRRRRPINDQDQEEIIEEPFEQKKAFLVCSGGKCFRYGIIILYTEIVIKKQDQKNLIQTLMFNT